jgi:hypothetical protein
LLNINQVAWSDPAGRTGGGKNSGEKIGNTIFMAMIEEMGGEK